MFQSSVLWFSKWPALYIRHPVSCILSMSKYHILILQVQPMVFFFFFLRWFVKFVETHEKSVDTPESSEDCPSLNQFVVHRAGYPCSWTTPIVLVVNFSSAACVVILCASRATVAPWVRKNKITVLTVNMGENKHTFDGIWGYHWLVDNWEQ